MDEAPEDGPGDGDDGEAVRRRVEERLVARYSADEESADVVRRAVAETYDRLAHARVTAFLPVLVERSVRQAVVDRPRAVI